ncbi:MAG: hypothetical protein HY288_17180 [Planctomycetia bacterium]|nr:hypothetical protein [Planctomycetia bacterium]
MSIELEARQSSVESYEQYRALSTAAVASLIVGLLSCLALLDWLLLGVPVIGIVLASLAYLKVIRHRDELSGEGLARAGLALSVLFLITGTTRLSYVYVTEVPTGYERVSYADLQPDPAEVGQKVPPTALELEGKRIFIKGYVYPGRDKDGIRQFLLVRDQGDCCFGGNPRITDRIQVTLVDPLRLRYQPQLHKVGGTFHVEPATAIGAGGAVFYHLKADYLE